jgi:integrase
MRRTNRFGVAALVLPQDGGSMKLTDTKIRDLVLPEGVSSKTFFDDELPGFGVRVRDSGGRTYVVQYRVGSQQRRLVLGSTTSLSLAAARSSAKDQLAKVRLGEDPFAAKLVARVAAGETFAALLPAFLEAKRTGIGAKRIVPRWHQQVAEFLTVAAKPLHGFAPRAITRAQISDLLTKVAAERGASAANKFRAVLSSYFSWLIGAGRADANPVNGTNKPTTEVARERKLSDAELRKIWHALDGEFGDIVKLLILTGARRDMIGSLCWSEIDFDAKLITLPPERMKNDRAFEIPMTPAVIALLKAQPRREGREFVFGSGEGGYSGWSKSKAELDERVQLPEWVLHDFRRSFSSTLHDDKLRVEPHIVEALLSHVQPGVGGVYNKAAYRQQKREALEKWADHVAKHVSATATVRKLRA